MIAAWKSVHVKYGELYALLLMDETIFERLFTTLQDGESTWHLFTAEKAEISHTGNEMCLDPDRLISESNNGNVFRNENGKSVCAFSMTMSSPE